MLFFLPVSCSQIPYHQYRTDIIHPLTTKEIHQLSEMVMKYQQLKSLRERVLKKLPKNVDPQLTLRTETSISKSELEDIYAPFKPPSKGSLVDRIRNEHPELIPIVDSFWEDCSRVPERILRPRDAAVILLANKIASHTATTDALLQFVERNTYVVVAKATTSSTTSSGAASNSKTIKDNVDKYLHYYNFSVGLCKIKDHQVLAIRRGVNQKFIKMTYDIYGSRAEEWIRRSLIHHGIQKRQSNIWIDAIHDAWSRLLRKRTTSRLWSEKCSQAEKKAIDVFCDNLLKALLAPPLDPPRPVLALDPGFAAGIKCAILDKDGGLMFDENQSLVTVKFLERHRQDGKQRLQSLLQILHGAHDPPPRGQKNGVLASNKAKKTLVTVALGNGHGSQEARALIQEASGACGIPIATHLVNEAGASVWSVTEGASREFPRQQPAAIASISIGRRFLNPLPELVKIPPQSLGLGMYQHDLSKKDLEEKLHVTSVLAVAEVGVDGNACSLEILEKIPGLTTTISERIIKARPLTGRKDLLDRVSGLGPKTFENCAAFIRVSDGAEPLDTTLVHPESYELARYLLKEFKWDLNKQKSIRIADLPKTEEERSKAWGAILEEASAKYGVSVERVISVVDHLIASITNPDPRLGGNLSIVSSSLPQAASINDEIGSVDGCSLIPASLGTSLEALKMACPLRGIIGTVRNLVDFGAFVDYGGERDALLHRSNMGIPLASLLVGQEIGIDILAVTDDGRINACATGLNLNQKQKAPPMLAASAAQPPCEGSSKNSILAASRARPPNEGGSGNSDGKRSYSATSSSSSRRANPMPAASTSQPPREGRSKNSISAASVPRPPREGSSKNSNGKKSYSTIGSSSRRMANLMPADSTPQPPREGSSKNSISAASTPQPPREGSSKNSNGKRSHSSISPSSSRKAPIVLKRRGRGVGKT